WILKQNSLRSHRVQPRKEDLVARTPCRFARSGTVASSRSASSATFALNAASNFLRDFIIFSLRRLRQSRTFHTLPNGPKSGVQFRKGAGHVGLQGAPL